ncbi:MAG TPA: hypothetical protein VJ978_08055 [Nitriliruptoraceae bacterium]|nr:hypothetical protein [Nitriliruptoraceae bacterium]
MARRGGVLGPILVVVAAVCLAATVVSWGVSQSSSDPVSASAAALGRDGYVLWDLRDDGSPVRWDPCSPVAWTTRPSDPEWLRPLAADAVASLAAHTGLVFQYTDAPHASGTGNLVGPQRPVADNDAWMPVLVTMTTPDESEWLSDADRALALPVTVQGQFVTGQILLQADVVLSPDTTSRDGSWGAALMHEWGHMVGLDHVDDPDQLMHDVALAGIAAWSGGDLRGLQELGADTSCLPPPPAREVELRTPRRR